MSWIRIAVAGLALCASASAASAQAPVAEPQGGQPGMRGQGRGQSMLLDGITLTASQEQKVDSIRASYRAERAKASPDGGGGPDSVTRKKNRALMDKQYAAIRALLNVDQQKLFDANVAAMKKRRESMRPAPRA